MKTEATAQAGVYSSEATLKNPAYQAYQILHIAFVVAPIIAGLDKFFMKLADWTMYLWPALGKVFGSPGLFMKIVGVIEIIAGFLVAFKPKIGAPIVALWLLGIIINLLLLQNYYDIALRDLGLCLGALALWRLGFWFDKPKTAT
jgi:hypothetical protein